MRRVTLTKKTWSNFPDRFKLVAEYAAADQRACVLLCIEMCNQLNWSQPAHVHVERRLRAEIRAVCARGLISD